MKTKSEMILHKNIFVRIFLMCNNWWKKSDTPYFEYFYILDALINFLASMIFIYAWIIRTPSTPNSPPFKIKILIHRLTHFPSSSLF